METKIVNKTFSNAEIKEKIISLQPLLSLRDIIGYAAARNTRVLSNAITEYEQFEREAILKYGTPDLDSDGNPIGTTSISQYSESFEKFAKEIDPLRSIEQELPIMVVDYEKVIGTLSGEEILVADWMFQDIEEG